MKKTILLLHGAIGAAEQFRVLTSELENYQVVAMDFPGHGKDVSETSFSIPDFAKSVIHFLDDHQIACCHVFGYSMGGYVAFYLAKYFPARVEKIITLATKFYWDEATALKETAMINAGKIKEKLPAFAETLASRHAAGWEKVLVKTAILLTDLGNENIITEPFCKDLHHSVLIMLGDKDKMVSIEETVDTYRSLPNARLCIMPNTKHPIEQVDTKLIRFFIDRFLQQA